MGKHALAIHRLIEHRDHLLSTAKWYRRVIESGYDNDGETFYADMAATYLSESQEVQKSIEVLEADEARD